MKKLISAVAFVVLAAGGVSAQPYKPNEAGVTMGHPTLDPALMTTGGPLAARPLSSCWNRRSSVE